MHSSYHYALSYLFTGKVYQNQFWCIWIYLWCKHRILYPFRFKIWTIEMKWTFWNKEKMNELKSIKTLKFSFRTRILLLICHGEISHDFCSYLAMSSLGPVGEDEKIQNALAQILNTLKCLGLSQSRIVILKLWLIGVHESLENCYLLNLIINPTWIWHNLNLF